MDQQEFMYRMMSMMRREEEEAQKPVKHYGFGLPKLYQIVDTVTGNTVTANEHRDAAAQYAEQTSEQIGHRFEVRGIWR